MSTDTPEGPIGELMVGLLRRLARRSRAEIERATSEGRHRLELRQMQRDRDAFWIRLGKSAYRLVESGEIDHPALRKAMERIEELERRIAELENAPPSP